MIEKQQKFISAVVYMHNCEYEIEKFIKTLYHILSENFYSYEIICVDDDSTDDTVVLINNLCKEFDDGAVNLVSMSYYQGLETAMHAGVDNAIGDFVFEFDSTNIDYDPELIMQVYSKTLEGFDIVSCGTKKNNLPSKAFYSIYNRNSNSMHDIKSEAFRIISRRSINRVNSMTENFPYRKAFYAGAGLKAAHISYNSKPRLKSNRNLKDPQDTALTSLMLFTDVAYKTTLFLTSILMLLTIFIVIYICYIYVTGTPVAGYTTIMLLLSGGFFAVFAILTLIVKYLSLILKTISNKQKYIISDIKKLTN